MSWRKVAAPIIRRVIREVGTSDEKKLRAALRESYPFGPRSHHPYKIWLDEIKRQLGKKKPPEPVRNSYPLPGQKELF